MVGVVTLISLEERFKERVYRFGIDDNIRFFKDIAEKRPASLFDNAYLRNLRELHEEYGTLFVLNLFYEDEYGFNLSQMPADYRTEWEDNADWLRLAFHSKNEQRTYEEASYEEILEECSAVHREIKRFAGDKSLSFYTTIHCYTGSNRGARAFRECGIKGVIACGNPDPERIRTSYYLNEEETCTMNQAGAVTDTVCGLSFFRNDIVINKGQVEDIAPILDRVLESGVAVGFMGVLLHEQYFYEDYPAYLADFRERMVVTIEWMRDHGYRSVFLEDYLAKTADTAGADERTPSRAQYFSWINNTNEGATQEHTLINIDFFKYLRDTYGMELDIYAWDAGNLDGAGGTYAHLVQDKLRRQYPFGYGPIVKAAADAGFRLGVWGGADGYGDTPEEEDARRELMVSLCRDHNMALFKFDTVCGGLRDKKRPAFAKTMIECRKYCPDLILLNHRNNLGEADVYATTFLWGGLETYIDVHVKNEITAMHNRAYLFSRGHVPRLQRLTEDHGVCISSCIDYFEDDLVYQAFGRSLILAPQIYGNPWLVRDDELPVLANIYNLHRRYRDILVDGMELPDFSGANCVSRGDKKRRFITAGNATWEKQDYAVTLDRTVGLWPCERVTVMVHHPYAEYVGEYAYGETAEIPVMPFRACLIEVCDSKVCEWNLPQERDASWEILKYADGKPALARQIRSKEYDNREKAPVYLATAEDCELPADAERLYETTCFALDNDTLERRAERRSGKTQIPQVQAARDAFFGQKTYALRGSDSSFLFDGNPDTFYDGRSKTLYGTGFRICDGCLRVDLGETVDCDRVEIAYYNTLEGSTKQILPQESADAAETSEDLLSWEKAPLEEIVAGEACEMEYVRDGRHDILCDHGRRMTAVYGTGPMRYFRLPHPVDRIYSFKVFKNGQDVTPADARANNLMAPYAKKQTTHAQTVVVVPETAGRLAVAVNGVHGVEGVYCAAEAENRFYGFTDRAASYPSNVWEHNVRAADRNTTHFLEITPELVGREIRVYVLYNTREHNCRTDVYWCPKHNMRQGAAVEL